MLLIVGALVVIGSVAGGYLMEGGHPLVLNQPSEFLIIGGSAIGSLLIGTPISVLRQLATQFARLFGSPVGKAVYVDLLAMLFQIFKVAQQTGVMALEPHFEAPDKSSDPDEVPVVPRAPRGRALPRRLGEGDHRRRHRAARPRSADGRGSRSPAPRSEPAGRHSGQDRATRCQGSALSRRCWAW